MNHYRKTIKKYRERQKVSGCPFCSEETIKQSIAETPHAYIVPNLTQYDLWELHDVVDHLLVVPKRHVLSFAELDEKERLDIMNILAEYESQNYNIYARGEQFVKRSVAHQHTHLIKVSNKKPRMSLFLQKPYMLVKF